MRFRIIFHHSQSWKQMHFHAMRVFAAVDFAWLQTGMQENKRKQQGRLELKETLHGSARAAEVDGDVSREAEEAAPPL